MLLAHRDIKVLKYIRRHKSGISKEKLLKKFSSKLPILDILEKLCNLDLICHNYTFPRNSSGYIIGEVPLTALYSISELGIIELDRLKWFDTEYVLSHIVIPIVLAIISTLITLFLTNTLALFQ